MNADTRSPLDLADEVTDAEVVEDSNPVLDALAPILGMFGVDVAELAPVFAAFMPNPEAANLDDLDDSLDELHDKVDRVAARVDWLVDVVVALVAVIPARRTPDLPPVPGD